MRSKFFGGSKATLDAHGILRPDPLFARAPWSVDYSSGTTVVHCAVKKEQAEALGISAAVSIGLPRSKVV